MIFFFLQASADKAAFNLAQASSIWKLHRYLQQLEQELAAERLVLAVRQDEIHRLELHSILRHHRDNFEKLKETAKTHHESTQNSVEVMNATLNQLRDFVVAHNRFWSFHKWGHVAFTLVFAATALISIHVISAKSVGAPPAAAGSLPR